MILNSYKCLFLSFKVSLILKVIFKSFCLRFTLLCFIQFQIFSSKELSQNKSKAESENVFYNKDKKLATTLDDDDDLHISSDKDEKLQNLGKSTDGNIHPVNRETNSKRRSVDNLEDSILEAINNDQDEIRFETWIDLFFGKI